MSEDWRDRIACRSVDPAVFEADDLTGARLTCAACPVQAECLADALAVRDVDTFRAGTTGAERAPMLQRVSRRTATVPVDKIVRLHRLHWAPWVIALDLGVNVDVVRRAIREHQTREAEPNPVGFVGLVRRRQALAAIGYSLVDLAPHLGVSWTTLSNQLLRGQVPPTMVDRWRRVYDELSGVRGPNGRARGCALKAGWLPPSAWDASTIDDPDALPRVDGEVAA